MTRDDMLRSANCSNCPMGGPGSVPKPVVPSRLPRAPVGLVIAEAPPKDESDRAAGPHSPAFTGLAARGLQEEIRKSGLDPAKLAYVYAVCCTPSTKEQWKRMGQAVNACAPVFHKQAAPHAHLPVLALGEWALFAWSGKRKATDKARGFVRHTRLRDVPGRSGDGEDVPEGDVAEPSTGDDTGDEESSAGPGEAS